MYYDDLPLVRPPQTHGRKSVDEVGSAEGGQRGAVQSFEIC